MISNRAEKKLLKAIEDEFENASITYGALYNSSHEGFAILLEEIEEMESEKKAFDISKIMLWNAIKKNSFNDQKRDLIEMEICAFKMLKENLQVCAVIEKFKETLENLEQKEKQNEN